MDPKMGAKTRSFFGHLAPFFCASRPWEPKWFPRPPPRAPKTSPSLDFHRFWVDFGRFFDDFLYHVGYFLSGLPHYFFGYLELSFSNFWPQVQMCWGRPQGSVRSQKSAMFAHTKTHTPTGRWMWLQRLSTASLWRRRPVVSARWRECQRQFR